ncbi:TPA: 2-hydroxyglutaryl-CoA dehydratase [bacterium]|nr:2-hydroxyglutaryl-CoA dehydratase [bacterium]
MITAGIDIGSIATKVVVFDIEKEKIISRVVGSTGSQPRAVAEGLLEEALTQAGVSRKKVEHIISTGYGRRAIEFPTKTITEISCCAKGVGWYLDQNQLDGTITVIDLGGQDTKVILLDENKDVTDFVMNDKCAAGTGRFLEVMANVLEVDLDSLGHLSLKSKNLLSINSTCTVFAESEVISLIAQGKNKEDIIAGICLSITERIVSMVRQVGEKGDIFFCGGGAKNEGIKKALKAKLGLNVYVPDEPQFVVALGAALFAKSSSSF